jgi:hypothetical protein
MNENVRAAIRSIYEEFPVEAIYLFGSVARGKANRGQSNMWHRLRALRCERDGRTRLSVHRYAHSCPQTARRTGPQARSAVAL